MRFWPVLLVGCSDPSPSPIGGQSGTEGAEGCAESARIPVVDPSAPAGGMAFSVHAAQGALGGRWVGDFAPLAAGEAEFVLDLTLFSDQAVAVQRSNVDGSACPPHYEVEAVAAPGLGAALEAEVPILLVLSSVDLALGEGRVDLGLVGGTLEPGFDLEQWPIQKLAISLAFADGGGRADLSFTAESAPPPTAASTGTAVAAAIEEIGGADLNRPE